MPGLFDKFRSKLPAALDRFRQTAPAPARAVEDFTRPEGVPKARPEGTPADLWDERGFLMFNVGDPVEFSSADGSGEVIAISSKKPQEDRGRFVAPREAIVRDGDTGVVVGLKGPDPIVRHDKIMVAYGYTEPLVFGYRKDDVVNLRLEHERKWGRRTPEGIAYDNRSMVRETMTDPPSHRAARDAVIAHALDALSVTELSGPRGRAWYAFISGGKPYTGVILTEDPAITAARYLDAIDYRLDRQANKVDEASALRRITGDVIDAVFGEGLPYSAYDLVEPLRQRMAAANHQGRLLWFEDAIAETWAALPKEPLVAAAVTKRIAIVDESGTFVAARPAYAGMELPTDVAHRIASLAGLSRIEDVFVAARAGKEVTLDVRGREKDALTRALFDG